MFYFSPLVSDLIVCLIFYVTFNLMMKYYYAKFLPILILCLKLETSVSALKS